MRLHILLLLLAIGCDWARDVGKPYTLNAFPFYHSSDQLASEAKALETGGCAGLRVSFERDGALSVPVARLTGGTDLKAMIVFGVHGRELISAETGLGFLRRLCSAEAISLRQRSSFVIVLNANPGGRRKVEDGEYCFRTNLNGVDINRNYGFHWEAESFETISGPTSHGSKPFSEPETRVIAKLLNESKPDLFVDVHSGANALLQPFGYDWKDIPDKSQRELLDVLSREVKEKHCPTCSVGAAAQDLGYRMAGTSVDYVYSLGVRFPFIWEIYDSTETITSLVAIDSARRTAKVRNCSKQSGSSPAVPSFLSRRRPPESILACADPELRALTFMDTQAERRTCLSEFNPETEAELKAHVARWSAALLTVSSSVQARVSAGQ